MKVGILTFHRSHNYGAVLQCYALKCAISGMGHSVYVIDYYPRYAQKKYKIIKFNSLRGLLVLVLTFTRKIKRRIRFDRFIEKYLSPAVIDCDLYIIGSDQVWNTKLTNGFDKVFWGSFAGMKITYAVSMEKSGLTEHERKMIRMYLRNFEAISVREKKIVSMLNPLTNKTIHHVIDPVLLDRHVFDKIAIKPQIKRYILVYYVRSNPLFMSIVRDIARQTGLEVVFSVIRPMPNKYQCASPEEFVGLIKYADFVVTTSFHGVAFSVLFNRQFYAVRLNDGNDDRIESLLGVLSLSDRFIDKNTDITPIDYSGVSLDMLRQESLGYLRSFING